MELEGQRLHVHLVVCGKQSKHVFLEQHEVLHFGHAEALHAAGRGVDFLFDFLVEVLRDAPRDLREVILEPLVVVRLPLLLYESLPVGIASPGQQTNS